MQDLCNTQDGAHCGNSNRFQSLSFVKGAPAQMPQGSYIHPKNIRSGEVLEQYAGSKIETRRQDTRRRS